MSKRKLISQTEARALKRRVHELEQAEDQRRSAWVESWPGGVHLGSVASTEIDRVKVRTARRLGHAVVCTETNGALQIYALPIGDDV